MEVHISFKKMFILKLFFVIMALGGRHLMNILFFILPKEKTHFIYDNFSLRQAIEKMENSGFTSVPIINKKGEYISTITEGDILRYVKSHENLSLKNAEKINVHEIEIKREVKSIKVYEDIENLLEIVLDQNFVPIIDDMNHFIGIVTRKSIISYFIELRKKGEN